MRASQTSPTIPIRPVIGMLDRVGSRVLEERLEQEVIPHLLPLRGGPVKPLPAHAREAALRALDEPGRRPSRGLPELRHAIAERLEQETGIILDPEREILITNGAMQAINIVFRALLSPDDRVLIPTPSFYLEGCTRLCGAEPIYVPGREDDDGDPVGRWRWDLDRIDASMTSATR